MTKFGYTTIGIATIFSFVLIVISIYVNQNYIKIPLLVIAIGFTLFTLYFFRDPERNIPDKKGIVLSPADGKVLLIKEVNANKFIEGEAQQVSIFMSPLNVHVNRIPITGKVDFLEYVHGKYLVAFNDKADEENERNLIGISSEYGKVFYTQVAGFVARRIISTLQLGDSVKIGERFGMIKFGSRVDVVVDKSWKLLVSEGDAVTAGETVIFEKRENSEE